jgi:hypothetical protein
MSAAALKVVEAHNAHAGSVLIQAGVKTPVEQD